MPPPPLSYWHSIFLSPPLYYADDDQAPLRSVPLKIIWSPQNLLPLLQGHKKLLFTHEFSIFLHNERTHMYLGNTHHL